MVAFIRFCLEVFLQTFYATLPCFCKCKKCGFGWCQTFPIFSHILLNFWILEKMWYCFCILEQINTRIFQNLLLILWQTLLWAPNSMYTKSVCCLQNRSKIFSGCLRYPNRHQNLKEILKNSTSKLDMKNLELKLV